MVGSNNKIISCVVWLLCQYLIYTWEMPVPACAPTENPREAVQYSHHTCKPSWVGGPFVISLDNSRVWGGSKQILSLLLLGAFK